MITFPPEVTNSTSCLQLFKNACSVFLFSGLISSSIVCVTPCKLKSKGKDSPLRVSDARGSLMGQYNQQGSYWEHGCSVAALLHLCYRSVTALLLPRYCSGAALLLLCYGFVTALLLLRHCSVTALYYWSLLLL